MKDVLFISLIGMAALVLQTTSWVFLIPAAYKPDLILILVLWASLRMTFLIGVGFAFAGGVAVDMLSGSPTGLFAIIYCLLFVTCGFLHATVSMDVASGRALAVFGSTLAAGCVVLCLRWQSGPVELSWGLPKWILLKSTIAALASLAIFPAVDSVWARYSRLVGAH